MILDEFKRHNLFLNGLEDFRNNDPHLSLLKGLKFIWKADWWKQMDLASPGIYILTGGRQIGKSTSAKFLIEHALSNDLFSRDSVFYLSCDQVDDHHNLSRIVNTFLEDIGKNKFLLIIDEVTFVKEWDRAIKALADDGSLRNGICILTGSDSVVLKEASQRFPGRRGSADRTDFHIHPLSFHEYLSLVAPYTLNDAAANIEELYQQFDMFQQCGGYLKAINDLHTFGEVRKATFLTFEQWIRGDFEKRKKNPDVLLGVLKTIMETSTTQVSYSSLAHKMGSVVKETFIDYMGLLERMDIIFELEAFDQNTMLGFPKKARKIHFCDPFIMETIARWLVAERRIGQKDLSPIKAESIVASECKRRFPSYYLKADGEIDVILVEGRKFTPVEIKWTNQLRPQDLKQLSKYKNSVILTKNSIEGRIGEIKAVPLPLFLVKKCLQSLDTRKELG